MQLLFIIMDASFSAYAARRGVSEMVRKRNGNRRLHAWIFMGICTIFMVTYAIIAVQMHPQVHAEMISMQMWRDALDSLVPIVNQEAIEPRVDPIWKRIPGYDGRVLDVTGSMLRIEKELNVEERTRLWNLPTHKSNPFTWANELPLVFHVVSPKKTLTDLGNEPIYPLKKQVAFFVNVAWGEDVIPEMLSLFESNQVKVTFFVEGRWARKNQTLLKTMIQAGHEIGNHSDTHPQMDQLSKEQIQNEIQHTEASIQPMTLRPSQFFAPPSGAFNQLLLQEVAKQKMHTVLWTVDTVDWKKPTPEQLIRRVQSRLEPGSIILMHPTEQTLRALPGLIKSVREKELQLVTASELLSSQRPNP
jgi:peptidoglycan-N-acetylglucosamine deacetylase